MPSFTIAEPHDQPSSCLFRPGHTLSSLPGQSVSLTSTTFYYPVRDSSRSGTMYTLPRSSKTQLSCEIDAYPGAQQMSHLHQLNEYCQQPRRSQFQQLFCFSSLELLAAWGWTRMTGKHVKKQKQKTRSAAERRVDSWMISGERGEWKRSLCNSPVV